MSMYNAGPITFVDTLLPDGSVERTYSNGVRERRFAVGPGLVEWNDSRGNRGRDINLGRGQVRREEANGQVSFGQDVGNGATIWNNGQYLSVNQTMLPEPPLPSPPPPPGGFGGLLFGLGLGGLIGLSAGGVGPYGVDPESGEYALYAEDFARQEQLRRQQAAGTSDSTGSGGSDFGGGDTDSNGSDDTGSSSGGWDSGGDSFG